jgi:hypothetical protein
MILAASAILQARTGPSGTGRRTLDGARGFGRGGEAREFVDLLHREIEQLHRDKSA